MNTDTRTVQELIAECMRRDILVPADLVEDRERILALLAGERVSQHTVTVVKNYAKRPKKRSVEDFVKYFTRRYEALSSILRARKELQSVMSIGRVFGKEKEKVYLIGLVVEKKETKGGHVIITIEDPTGRIECWVNANNKELQEVQKEVVLDECIGIVGQAAGTRVFCDSILFPDVPLHREMKHAKDDCYVVFVGDVEVGANLFLKEEFEHFLLWISGKLGSEEQREVAQKVGYVVFIGDLIHGVGVYPGQEKDQTIHDVKEQYAAFAEYVRTIPSHIQIMVIPGNHDVGRLQEPQLPIAEEYAPELYAMPNVHVLSNPSTVTIAQTKDHPGFDILLYHGFSLVYYADHIQPIREAGGQAVTDQIMKLYLRKRHLAPTHGSNTYVPDADEDPMVIDRVPDFLVTGHVHRISHANYHGVTMINCGCWGELSEEQRRRGLEAEPGKVPIVNLRTRKLHIMNFYPHRKKHGEEAAAQEGGA